jgi:hypothetical protein
MHSGHSWSATTRGCMLKCARNMSRWAPYHMQRLLCDQAPQQHHQDTGCGTCASAGHRCQSSTMSKRHIVRNDWQQQLTLLAVT